MVWLILHQWILLLLAFLLGLLIGWWIWYRRERETVTEVQSEPQTIVAAAALPEQEIAAEPVALADVPTMQETRPRLYDTASDGPADDLKKISGIGPKLEGLLNDTGVYYFRQIRDWTPAEVAWIDSKLQFPGRIERDKWQAQAAILADGGDTDFASRYAKGETPSSYQGSQIDTLIGSTGAAAGATKASSAENAGAVDRASKYIADVHRYDPDAEEDIIRRIVNHLGIALQSRDASLVACSDKAERDQVANGFCAKKLGMDAETAQRAVEEVCQSMKADRNKQRVTFYYLLAKNAGKLDSI
ncbi:DUF2853 family protein [Parvularcula sp. IMCC14364]|uniref:DUF2853 family protein n=1 Tax=Parvularcula sp. IMCC14364 TaxID=3067902 RepID=UPI002741334D|nr:DUF2853 family protein [Parvularcula sp. IMCC14364]